MEKKATIKFDEFMERQQKAENKIEMLKLKRDISELEKRHGKVGRSLAKKESEEHFK